MAAHSCNPNYLGELQLEARPGKKLGRLNPTNKLGVINFAYNPSYSGGVARRQSLRNPIQKITKAKKDCGV
jgi:hypothetical protein